MPLQLFYRQEVIKPLLKLAPAHRYTDEHLLPVAPPPEISDPHPQQLRSGHGEFQLRFSGFDLTGSLTPVALPNLFSIPTSSPRHSPMQARHQAVVKGTSNAAPRRIF